MADRFPCRRGLYGGLAVLLLCAWTGGAKAQEQLGTQDTVYTPFKLPDTRNRWDKLVSGDMKPDAKDKALCQLAARYFTYRLTWSGVHKETKDTVDGGAVAIQKELDGVMTAPGTQSGKNKEFMKMFTRELVAAFKEVLALDMRNYHFAVTRCALMMPSMAKSRQPEVHDYLLDIVKPKGDSTTLPFIRMCAVRALGEFNNPHWSKIEDQDDPTNKEQKAKLKRDLDRLEAVAGYIAWPYAPGG